MRLTEAKEKIKSLALLLTKKDVYVAIIIVLVGLASFFLGALWQKDQNREDVTIKSADTAVFEAENGNEEKHHGRLCRLVYEQNIPFSDLSWRKRHTRG